MLLQTRKIVGSRIEEAGTQNLLDMVTVSNREVASALHVQQTALYFVDNLSALIQKSLDQTDVSREREFHVK